jgi:hypothetical protein
MEAIFGDSSSPEGSTPKKNIDEVNDKHAIIMNNLLFPTRSTYDPINGLVNAIIYI